MRLPKTLFVPLLCLAASAAGPAASEIPDCALDINAPVTLSAGTYNFCYVSLHAQATLIVSGKVLLLVDHSLHAEPGSLIDGRGRGGDGGAPAGDAAAPCGGRGSLLKLGGGGGGHGGRGGDGAGNPSSGGGSCDDPSAPALAGGGGGGAYGAAGGSGGSCLVLRAPSSRLLGDMDFSGEPGSMGLAGSGGGAGGAFHLYGEAAEFAGHIAARGGAGGGWGQAPGAAPLNKGGSGGGGLVCIDTAQPLQGQGSVDLAGGPGASAGQVVFRLHQSAPLGPSPTAPPAPAGQAFLDRNVVRPGQGPLRLRFSPAQGGRVRARVYDLQGRGLATLFDAQAAAGVWREAAWDPLGAGPAPAAGVYLVSVQGAGLGSLLKVIVLR